MNTHIMRFTTVTDQAKEENPYLIQLFINWFATIKGRLLFMARNFINYCIEMMRIKTEDRKMSDTEIKHNKAQHKFYVELDGKKGVLEYDKIGNNILDYKSTYVDEAIRHKGIGSDLVKKALEYAEEKNYKVRPSCPFVERYADMHDKYEEILV